MAFMNFAPGDLFGLVWKLSTSFSYDRRCGRTVWLFNLPMNEVPRMFYRRTKKLLVAEKLETSILLQ